MGEALLIAGWNNPVTADYAIHESERRQRKVLVLSSRRILSLVHGHAEACPPKQLAEFQSQIVGAQIRIAGTVIFLDADGGRSQEELVKTIAALTRKIRVGCVCLVSSFRVHFGDRKAEAVESFAVRQFQSQYGKLVVLRPGHVMSRHSAPSLRLKRFGGFFAACPSSWRSCFVTGDELFSVIERVLIEPNGSKMRVYTLFGSNLPWRSQSRENSASPLLQLVLHLFVVQQALMFALRFLSRRWPEWRIWNFDTLCPKSARELLAIYNPYNSAHVKIVGYNNGVIHFGQNYPGKTVVSTVKCTRATRLRGNLVKLDAGTTLRTATDELRSNEKAFHVLPNFSYVSSGTGFFVPIHGSASRFSTVAETIEKVVLYDPLRDRIIVARRGCEEFGRYLYNLKADVLLLRLYIKVKDRSSYYVRTEQFSNPKSADVLALFHDQQATNVEARKAGAANPTIAVSRYYSTPPSGSGQDLEVPRDKLGSLWDRLEENPITRALFHGLTRRLAHHVELFLSEKEFESFWNTHGALPLKKLQFRFIKQDQHPHSPFRDGDSISVDLFMMKKHRKEFENYLKRTFGTVRMNPGKHSMS